jgi:hypothetical protein
VFVFGNIVRMGDIHKPHPIKVGFRIAEHLRQLAVDKKGTTVSGKEGEPMGVF